MGHWSKDSKNRDVTVQRTVLFTDIVHSAERLLRLGPEGWAAMIGHHRCSIEAVTSPVGGIVAGFTGDGFMVAFVSAASGVKAALRLQRAIWAQNELEVRIGVASGLVVPVEMGSYVGECVHRAARLCAATNRNYCAQHR